MVRQQFSLLKQICSQGAGRFRRGTLRCKKKKLENPPPNLGVASNRNKKKRKKNNVRQV